MNYGYGDPRVELNRGHYNCGSCIFFSDYRYSDISEIYLCLKFVKDEPVKYMGKDCTHIECWEPYRCYQCKNWTYKHEQSMQVHKSNVRHYRSGSHTEEPIFKRFGSCKLVNDKNHLFHSEVSACLAFEYRLQRPLKTDIEIIVDVPVPKDIQIIKDIKPEHDYLDKIVEYQLEYFQRKIFDGLNVSHLLVDDVRS